jgi:SAM-dependent methyltransferase
VRGLRRLLLLGFAAWLVLRAWAARHPTPFPYFGRPILDLPRPLVTRGRLLSILSPSLGEQILEIGPGTGYYSLPVAERLGPGGTLEVLDIHRSFLDDTVERARGRGIENIVATLGDGALLPYEDQSLDAAFLVSTLGEIPDPEAALRELRRVLKPPGRLVVGEIFLDPDFVRFGWLLGRARAVGLHLERRSGTPLGYFARFTLAT